MLLPCNPLLVRLCRGGAGSGQGQGGVAAKNVGAKLSKIYKQAEAGAVPSSGLVDSLVNIEFFCLLEIQNKLSLECHTR